jgi:hypothetical protein
MTVAQPDRLDRIEALLERMAIESERSKRESDERFEELTAVTQAIGRDMAQLITTQQKSSQVLNEAMIRLANTPEGVIRLLGSLDEDRPTILRKLNTIEGKVDSLLQHQRSET